MAPPVRVLVVLAASATLGVAPLVHAQTSPAPATPGPTGEPLAAEQALAMALDANPSLHAALLDAVAARQNARAAELSRSPVLTASAQGQYTESLAGTATGPAINLRRGVNASLGLSYTTPIGTVVSVTLTHAETWTQQNLTAASAASVVVGPATAPSATLSLRQPLIRGGGRDAVLAAQRQAAARAEGSDEDAVQAASQLVQDVLVAYWELWYAERQVAVQAEAATLAAQQAAQARQQRTLGTLAPADVLQYATAEATLRTQASTALANRTARANELARLLGLSMEEAASLHVGGDLPETPSTPAIDQVLARLRATSPIVRGLEADVEVARNAYVAAANGARARLDLTGTAGMSALWLPNDSLPGLQLPGGRPAFVATVGVELELPLVSDRAEATRAASRAQLDAAEARLAAELQRIEASLSSRRTTLEAAIERISLTAATATVAGELAEAERGRQLLGTSIPTVLLSAQQTDRESRLGHDRALVDAAEASVQLAHDAGLLLDRFSITVPGDEGR